MIIVLMGPCGCGKTTVGEYLNKQLGWSFYDADNYHSDANVEKMQNGIALTDADRKPWLKGLSSEIKKWNANNGNAILACSALKDIYRKMLGVDQKTVVTVFLEGSYDLLSERMKKRSGHYMDPNLLQSQLDTLEIPNDGFIVSIDQIPEKVAETIITSLKLKND